MLKLYCNSSWVNKSVIPKNSISSMLWFGGLFCCLNLAQHHSPIISISKGSFIIITFSDEKTSSPYQQVRFGENGSDWLHRKLTLDLGFKYQYVRRDETEYWHVMASLVCSAGSENSSRLLVLVFLRLILETFCFSPVSELKQYRLN